MDRNFFETQMTRLRNQWPHSYKQDRSLTLFQAFQNVPNTLFVEVVNEVIWNRSAPMLEDFFKAEQTIKERMAQGRSTESMSAIEMLKDMAANTKLANPELVKEKIKLYEKLVTGQINKAQFDEGIDFLGSMDGC